jgi:hypothetical protein
VIAGRSRLERVQIIAKAIGIADRWLLTSVVIVAESQKVAQLTLKSLERRIVVLEKGMAEWQRSQETGSGWKDWRKALGKFVPSEISEEVDAAGRKIREADRRKSKA